jgi:hypothetical protein
LHRRDAYRSASDSPADGHAKSVAQRQLHTAGYRDLRRIRNARPAAGDLHADQHGIHPADAHQNPDADGYAAPDKHAAADIYPDEHPASAAYGDIDRYADPGDPDRRADRHADAVTAG